MGVYEKSTGIRLGAYVGRLDFLWRKTSPEQMLAFLVDVRMIMEPPADIAEGVKIGLVEAMKGLVEAMPVTAAEAARRALVGAPNGQKESALCYQPQVTIGLEGGGFRWVSSQQAVMIGEQNSPAMLRLNQCRSSRSATAASRASMRRRSACTSWSNTMALRRVLEQLEAEIS